MGVAWVTLALGLVVAYAVASRGDDDHTMRPIRTLTEQERQVLETARREMAASEDSLF